MDCTCRARSGSTAHHALQVTLLGALGKLLAQTDVIDDAVVQQGLHVVGRIAQAYRGLWPKQRPPVHAALNRFLAALAPKQVVLQSVVPQLVAILLSHTVKPAADTYIAGEALLWPRAAAPINIRAVSAVVMGCHAQRGAHQAPVPVNMLSIKGQLKCSR